MICGRGPAFEALPKILSFWLQKYPNSFYIQKWLKDSLKSVEACLKLNNIPIPMSQDVMTVTSVPTKPPTKKKTAGGAKLKKPDTKRLEDKIDDDYIDVPEPIDTRSGGSLMVQRLFAALEVKVAGVNGHGHVINQGFYNMPLNVDISHNSSKEPMFYARVIKKLGIPTSPSLTLKRSSDTIDGKEDGGYSQGSVQALKRSRSEPGGNFEGVNRDKPAGFWPGETPMASMFLREGRKKLQDEANGALVEFIVDCGLSARVVDSKRFSKFIQILNPNYSLPSCSTFEYSLLPTRAGGICFAIQEAMKKRWNNAITFDGGKLLKKKFYSVHITDTDRQKFCIDLDDSTGLSMMADYIFELLDKWVSRIGPNSFSSICSDDAANTKKARKLLSDRYPRILNFADACHNLQNATKDISALPDFKKTIAELRKLLAFMSLSTYSLDHYNLARKRLGISHGLQSIGETRFATVYWSLESVTTGIEAFKAITRDPKLQIESDILIRLFGDDMDALLFKRDLEDLGAILMPFAHAIQCLEAKETNPADVYTYWLAVVAQLNDLFTSDSCKPTPRYSNSLKESIRKIANSRFSSLINNKAASNVYLIAFVLDPDNRITPILTDPNPLQVPTTTLVRNMSGGFSVKIKDPVSKIGVGLLQILQKEYGNEYRQNRTISEAQEAMKGTNPYLAPYTALEACNALQKQFKAYVNGEAPFNRRRHKNESLGMYWQRYLDDNEDDTRVLAALGVKICSALPVSMVDERAMSTVKWINSSRKGQQEVGTVANNLVMKDWMLFEDSEPTVRRFTTVKWRDIRATIEKRPKESQTGSQEEQGTPTRSCDEVLHMIDGLANASIDDRDEVEESASRGEKFDLEVNFVIANYADILSDRPLTTSTVERDMPVVQEPGGDTAVPADASASEYSLAESDWGTWE
ncbi:hypothetical protein NP233_g11501 [Leucocoprinus birnbaumii]|uniref:DUF659 domain-containing protein n=1 Tax=Leucocoprinus birnbaumii TaxID=56174 RepID=A0AAD5YNX2_9AGAR|nr:hypothetical protein NP233_g11501 [Leucocoprinus birnbaumii]